MSDEVENTSLAPAKGICVTYQQSEASLSGLQICSFLIISSALASFLTGHAWIIESPPASPPCLQPPLPPAL